MHDLDQIMTDPCPSNNHYLSQLYERELWEKIQFPKLDFGPGLYQPQGSKVKGQIFFF